MTKTFKDLFEEKRADGLTTVDITNAINMRNPGRKYSRQHIERLANKLGWVVGEMNGKVVAYNPKMVINLEGM